MWSQVELGLQQRAVESMLFRTIKKPKHLVRASHGMLDQNFGIEYCLDLKQLQGVKQDSVAGPPISTVTITVFQYTMG